MSLTLATVADALIEFILSLLRDPEVAAEFDEDPDQALAARGLQNTSPSESSVSSQSSGSSGKASSTSSRPRPISQINPPSGVR